MQAADLEALGRAARALLRQDGIADTIARLKAELPRTEEPFVWSQVDLAAVGPLLPAVIRSGWLFVLRRDAPSGAHHHPNSVQHMLVVEGACRAHVGGAWRQLAPQEWAVIPAGVPHEFIPAGQDMVVLSFHTCAAEELEEVSAATGATRQYA
jgi:quercetin dioxygenase-like cupin family protein